MVIVALGDEWRARDANAAALALCDEQDDPAGCKVLVEERHPFCLPLSEQHTGKYQSEFIDDWYIDCVVNGPDNMTKRPGYLPGREAHKNQQKRDNSLKVR